MMFKKLLAAGTGLLTTTFPTKIASGSSSVTRPTVMYYTSSATAITTGRNPYNKNISPRSPGQYSYYGADDGTSSFNPSALVSPTGNLGSPTFMPTTTRETQTFDPIDDIYPYPNSHPTQTPPPDTTQRHLVDSPPAVDNICTYNMTINYCPQETFSIPDVWKSTTSIIPLSTMATVTVMKSHGIETTVTSTATPIHTIAGCRHVEDCPRCEPFKPCYIGKLSPFCVGHPIALNQLAPNLWKQCREELKTLTREERKAWAVQMTPPPCLKIDEWDPRDIDWQHGGDCHQTVHDWSKQEEAKNAWISGLIPIQCPWSDKDGPGDWHRFPNAVRKGCKNAIKVLNKPFDHEPHTRWGLWHHVAHD